MARNLMKARESRKALGNLGVSGNTRVVPEQQKDRQDSKSEDSYKANRTRRDSESPSSS